MTQINTLKIEEAVYNLCIIANTEFDGELYSKLKDKYEKTKNPDLKTKLNYILQNIKLAKDSKRPLCQDTGQVIIFVQIGQNVQLCGKLINMAINDAIKKAYDENYFRKSVVKNALFNRENTNSNTPSIIYTEIIEGDEIILSLLIKGAGAENYSQIKMFKPSDEKEKIFEFIKETINIAGEKACPPLVLGIGAGGTLDTAAILSKKAFFNESLSEDELGFVKELKEYIKEENDNILDIKLKTNFTHIASMPVAVTINCHSTRHSSCKINSGKIEYKKNDVDFKEIHEQKENMKEIQTADIEQIKHLKHGENILLTGEIYTARDAAHKKIKEHYDKFGELPFELKDKIIFYAGPCPPAPNEISGPIGPTTSARMDEFCELMYENGLLASIGKGERSQKAIAVIKKHNGKYFTMIGGVACLIAKRIKKSEIIAYEELGAEAVRKLYVEKLPVKVFI